MSVKRIKAQFNDSCVAGLELSLESSALFANRNKMVCIEVGRDGINIQPGPGGTLYINTHDVRGPLYKGSSMPFDWLPNIPWLNMTPRKKFDLPVMNTMASVGICTAAFSAVLAV